MTERGGPTAQSIVYQNKIAGLYLGDLLSFDSEGRDRVVEVRVEAPAHVDDVVVRYADGHRTWIHVKLSLSTGSEAWAKLWQDFYEQRGLTATADIDRLALVLGEASKTAELLAQCADRTRNSSDEQWRGRLSDAARELVEQIERQIGASPHPIFERLSVEVVTEDALDEALIEARMPHSTAGARTLHDTLTTLAGEAGLRRAAFNAQDLRALLRERSPPVVVDPPSDWGLAAYLQVRTRARIDVPGTSVGGDVAKAFCWPRTALTEHFERDFDDEQELEKLEEEPEALDLKLFPTPDFAQAIIHAGPGFGKSALFVALSQRLANERRYVPVILPLGAFSETNQDVLSYLDGAINDQFHVKIAWMRLLETGAAVILFDGFDEVPTTRRASVTDRLAVFMGRFPETPWLLSVRDPAYVPARIDARKVELLPLLDREMRDFIEHISPGAAVDDIEKLIAQIEAYPDLQRLVRIPLFLALLVATQRPGAIKLSRRSELIEAYLTTLFRPEEHKNVPRPKAPDQLREAVQALAYSLLKSGQIGAGEQTVRRVLKEFASDRLSVDDLSDDARVCGILRREAGGRVNFPFPIVQEYLAAQALIDRYPHEIAPRLASGIDRPWAQAIQFALEKMENASDIARDLLAKPDDPFASASRLLARCVINGMRCDDAIRDEIGDRLMTAWLDQSFWTRQRIGRLLQDGWSRPLAPRLRRLLLSLECFHAGGEEILADLYDETLTLDFLKSALRSKSLPPHLGVFQPAVDAVAARAFALYLQGVRKGVWKPHKLWEAAAVIYRLDGGEIPEVDLIAAATDEGLPTAVRLASLGLCRQPDEELMLTLSVELLRRPDASDRWAATHTLRAAADPEAHLASLLRRDDLHPTAHDTIIEHLEDTLPDVTRRITFLREQANAPDLSDKLKLDMRVWAAIIGDAESLRSLVRCFADLPERAVHALIWSINAAPDREDGERLVAAMRARSFSAEERATAIGNLILGATNTVRAHSWATMTMTPSKPHAAFPQFVGLLAEWRQADDYDLGSRLRIETDACRTRIPGAGEALQRLATEVALNEDLSGEKNPLFSALSMALWQLEKLRLHVPLQAAIRMTEEVEPIERQATLRHVASIGTREALDYLLSWTDKSGFHKSVVLHGVEQTSARLGLKIVRSGPKLAIAG